MFINIYKEDLNFLSRNNASQSNQENNNKNSDTRNMEQAPVYKPERNQEIANNMTKEQVLNKLINTIDYFKTAKGSFEEYTQSGGQWVITYQLMLNGEESAGYSKVYNSVRAEKDHSTYFSKNKIWLLDEKAKTYNESDLVSKKLYGEPITIDKAIGETKVKKSSIYRDIPQIGFASHSLFPYELATKYLSDISKWEIEKQNEKLLNHNVIVVGGTLDKSKKAKIQSSTFKLWVDKDTGILIKYETYNDAGELINYLHTKELRINEKINKKTLSPNLKGFKQTH
ncbi:sigma-E factor regulatory protein RseB domain-containing protein [Mesobacillus boroniphilus]|uniref:MucB/RseB N-terminal domain-containing protein n=1 Tax=Mesobacillus boroniphilus JCM 21738 TaxID=1294265 RepID=W4RUM8_9BACI|nr:sigma-E factor regulatory protein RseB domain-containing protein [Mesobacillus boroniphilus]GAE47996.1 hypothetical protein JCM21738_5048 [Mesobacillus boroniphilus JCM 21738]